MASGVVVLLGAFRVRLARTSLMLSALVYGTFGLSRLVSMAFDGLPSTSLMVATGVELVAGTLALVALFGSVRSRSFVLGDPS